MNEGIQAAPQFVQLKRPNIRKRFKESKILLLMVFPCVLYYLIFNYAPMFGILISFQKYNLFKGVWHSEWIGLKNYSTFFHSRDFFSIIKNTFILSFCSILFGFPAPILLALLLNELKHNVFKRFVQSISYLPHFLSNVIVVSMIVVFLSPSNGLINRIIGIFGFEAVNWLTKPEWFRFIYISSGIWQGVGWASIIYLAALTAVDTHLYEAAEMDGAGRFKRMLHVSIPGIMPVIVILLILDIGNILEVGFEKVFLLYNPTLYETADIINTYVYRVGLEKGNYSYATAIGMFTGLVNLTLLISANYISRKVGETSLW